MSSESPLDLPSELQHLIEKRDDERRQEERRQHDAESAVESDSEPAIVNSDQHAGPERRSGEDRRSEERRESE